MRQLPLAVALLAGTLAASLAQAQTLRVDPALKVEPQVATKPAAEDFSMATFAPGMAPTAYFFSSDPVDPYPTKDLLKDWGVAKARFPPFAKPR